MRHAILGLFGRGPGLRKVRDVDRAPGRQLVEYRCSGRAVATRFRKLPAVGDLVELGTASYRVLIVWPGSVRERRGTVVEVCPVCR